MTDVKAIQKFHPCTKQLHVGFGLVLFDLVKIC